MTAPAALPATIRVNGEARPLVSDGLIGVLKDLDIDPAARGLAIAVNGAVVRRGDWVGTALKDGDTIEIVKPFAGG